MTSASTPMPRLVNAVYNACHRRLNQKPKNQHHTMKKLLITLGTAAMTVAGANAQVVLNTIGAPYTENFNSLGTGNVTWTDNSTLTGWYLTAENSQVLLVSSNGSSSTGQAYNFGATSNSDRSIGYIGSNSNDWTNYFLRLQNNTGSVITALDISYDGRLWRSGGAQPSNSNNSFAFYYASGFPTLPDSTSVTGWTAFTSLNYAPTVDVSSGSLSGNATIISASLTGLNIPQGGEITLRWFGNNGSGVDAGLAIDNLSVNPVPEPSTWLLFGLGSAAVLARLRRRKV